MLYPHQHGNDRFTFVTNDNRIWALFFISVLSHGGTTCSLACLSFALSLSFVPSDDGSSSSIINGQALRFYLAHFDDDIFIAVIAGTLVRLEEEAVSMDYPAVAGLIFRRPNCNRLIDI